MSGQPSDQGPGTITARIFRFDPSRDSAPRYDVYEVPFRKWMRVLDVLDHVAEDLGDDLAHRWFCGVKKCGACGVRLNGRAVLACWEPAVAEMTIEPLAHVDVIRDLVIERQAYETRLQDMHPALERRTPYPGFPEPLTHREMSRAASARDCIQCLCCASECPVLDAGVHSRFAGPALLVQLAQYALDPRDGMDRGRLASEQAAVWSCVSCYACEEVCPADIRIVSDVIEPLKARAYTSAPKDGGRHAGTFMSLVKKRGYMVPAALVLRTQGVRALRKVGRISRLVARGKADPRGGLGARPIPGIRQVQKLFDSTEGDAR